MINPILKKEGQVGVRKWTFPLMVTIYTLAIAGTAIITFINSTKNAYFEGIQLNSSLKLFLMIAFIQTIMLVFIVPALTATSITSEKEKQTLDVLFSTKMSPFSIVIGKFIGAVSKVILLLVLALPIYALSFLIGGVALSSILKLIIFHIVLTLWVGSIGIFFSTIFGSSRISSFATYCIVFLLVILIIFAINMFFIDAFQDVNKVEYFSIPKFVLFLPFTGLLSFFISEVGIGNFGNGFIILFTPILTMPGIENAIYYSQGFMILSTIVLIYFSAARLNPLRKKKNKNKLNKAI